MNFHRKSVGSTGCVRLVVIDKMFTFHWVTGTRNFLHCKRYILKWSVGSEFSSKLSEAYILKVKADFKG